MKALLPVFCRPVGYLVLLIALFILPVLYIQGMVTDHNLLFYKECTKLLMMSGCLLIIFALSKNESRETECGGSECGLFDLPFCIRRNVVACHSKGYH